MKTSASGFTLAAAFKAAGGTLAVQLDGKPLVPCCCSTLGRPAHLAWVHMAGEGQQRVPGFRILKSHGAADALVRSCGRDGVAGSVPLLVLLMTYDQLHLVIFLWNASDFTRMHLETATYPSPHTCVCRDERGVVYMPIPNYFRVFCDLKCNDGYTIENGTNDEGV